MRPFIMHRVDIYSRGYSLKRDFCVDQFRKGGGKRGKLTGKVSSASFRRLRKFCITHDVCDSDCWGVTLTVPGLDLISPDDFKALHHKLCVFCNDRSIPCIWRVELQQRGQPHLHIVIYGDVQNALLVMSHWYKLLDKCPGVSSPEIVSSRMKDIVFIKRSFVTGWQHAVNLQRLTGDYRSYRYLVAHMSKSKTSQLGWTGRNWGVCNKSCFVELVPNCYYLDDVSFYHLRRWVSRMTLGVPCKRKGKRVNKLLDSIRLERNKKKSKSRNISFRDPRKMNGKNCAFWLGNPYTIKLMIDFLRRNLLTPF